MKKILFIFLIIISFLNCKQNTKFINTDKENSINTYTNKQNDTLGLETNEVKNNISKTHNNETNLDTLIPIKILNLKSNDIYKKYGIDFTGTCYSCNLAQFRIENSKVIISNVGDYQDGLSFKITNFINTKKRIEIRTKSYTFIFVKIEEGTIFKIDNTNYDFQNKNLKISKYFTLKKDLMKFEIHDCGDFDG